MSVLTMDLKAFSYMHEGLKNTGYNSEVDDFYSPSIREHFRTKDIEAESTRLIKAWINLNDKSYGKKYKKSKNRLPMSEFYREYSHTGKITATQLLKFVQCLIYNIELEHWRNSSQEKADYRLLEAWSYDLLNAIVATTQEYKNASWDKFKPQQLTLTK